MDEIATTYSNGGGGSPSITIETLRESMRALWEVEAACDLEAFLSDNWDASRILIRGGSLIEINGELYAVETPTLDLYPAFKDGFIGPPKRFSL